MSESSIGLDQLYPASDEVEHSEIPEGTYDAEITNSEWRTSQTSGNQYVSVEFTLTSAPAGRKIWSTLNFKHPNPIVQEIAMRTASDIARAIGLRSLHEPHEMIGHALTIKVGSKSKEPDRREIKRYSASKRAVPAQTNGAAASKQQAQGPFPWEA